MGVNLVPWRRRREQRTDWPALSLSEGLAQILGSVSFAGNTYTLPGAYSEQIASFTQLVEMVYKGDPVVFALVDNKAKLFSEARFQFRQRNGGRPGSLFGTPELEPLEHPWPGGTTGDLLYRVMQYAELSGNAFIVANDAGGLDLLRPDWVDIIAGSDDEDAHAWDPSVRVIGYVYHPGGRFNGGTKIRYLPEQVAHYAPVPDPSARFRGMSWLTAALREVLSDRAATEHKLAFFENAATPNLLVKFDLDSIEKMRPWIELFQEGHEGAGNAYSSLFIGAGTDVTPVGMNFKQMDFKVTQGAGETRISAAAGVPPIVAGFSEGLATATYSNYSQARRRFSDQTMRPLWRNLCGCLESVIVTPKGSELWYDDRDIAALKEDVQDKAKETQENAQAASLLVMAGYDPDSVTAAIDAGDFTLLTHTGLPSVQLQPAPAAVPALNGA